MKNLKHIASYSTPERVVGAIIGLAGLGLLGWAGWLSIANRAVADPLTDLYKTPALVWGSVLAGPGLISLAWLILIRPMRQMRRYQNVLQTGDSFDGVVTGTSWESGHDRLVAAVDFGDGQGPVEVSSQQLTIDPSEYYPIGSPVTVRCHRNERDLFVFELDGLPCKIADDSPFLELDHGLFESSEPSWMPTGMSTVEVENRQVKLQFSNAVQTEESTWELKVHSSPRLRTHTVDELVRILNPYFVTQETSGSSANFGEDGEEQDLLCSDDFYTEIDGVRLTFSAWTDAESTPRVEQLEVILVQDDVPTETVRVPINPNSISVQSVPKTKNEEDKKTIDHWNDELDGYREGPWRDLFVRAWLDRRYAQPSLRNTAWSVWRVFLVFSISTAVLISVLCWFTSGWAWNYWLFYMGEIETTNQGSVALRAVPFFWFSLLIALGIGTCSGIAGGIAKFLQLASGLTVRLTRIRHVLRTLFLVVVVGLFVPWASIYAPIQARVKNNLETEKEKGRIHIPEIKEFDASWSQDHRWSAELTDLEPGMLRVTATWSSNQPLALMLNHSDEKNAIVRKDGNSPLSIEQRFGPEELERGGTWTVTIANLKGQISVNGQIETKFIAESEPAKPVQQ